MSDYAPLLAGLKEVATAADLGALEKLRVKYLGRDGLITRDLRGIPKLPPAERGQRGAELNAAQRELTAAIEARREAIAGAEFEQAAATISLDPTAPSHHPGFGVGHRHPVTGLIDELIELFWQLGFSVAEGPEIEDEWHNFTALNIPENHPARDLQDTFYLKGGNLPRTHTSPVQIRYMENQEPPIRIIAPGKVYRNEDEDATHSWMFYQIEGLVVDEGITLADLKGTLLAMIRGMLGDDAEIRLRPNYFPYTEPSMELDARFGGGDWLELGGAGMVHPQVLRNAGVDPEKYSGFAFGFGPERIAALRYGGQDIREFWRPDLKFLEQF